MSEWIKYSERKPTAKDADRRGCILIALADGSLHFDQWDDAEDGWGSAVLYWCTLDPLPTEESAVEKAEQRLFEWWKDLNNRDYLEGVEYVSALIDAKLAERK